MGQWLGGSRFSFARGTPPTWLNRSANVLATFGELPRYPDIVAVAAFPMAELRPDRVFYIAKHFEESASRKAFTSARTGRIRAAEVVLWK
jgi:hypothetical protein